jgi:hypothetical protein
MRRNTYRTAIIQEDQCAAIRQDETDKLTLLVALQGAIRKRMAPVWGKYKQCVVNLSGIS